MASKSAIRPVYDLTGRASPGGDVGMDPPEEHLVLDGKGELLGGGATGLGRTPGDVINPPWTGRPTAPGCGEEMATEARIYERLGAHPRLVQIKHWDPVDHTLTLEYMPHGNLIEYLEKHGRGISPARRRQWAVEAAEGLELLHSRGVIQGDVGPHSFLLDANLSLKICDFGGSSLDGSPAMVVPGVRYRLPRPAGAHEQPATIQDDLFALGSTIYFIATGHEPYRELTDEDEVERRYREGAFPDLGGILFAEPIALCWRQEAESAGAVVDLLRRSSAQAAEFSLSDVQ